MDGRFTRRQLIKGGLAVAAVPLLPGIASAAPRSYRVDVPPLPWPAANDIVANTTIPTFPDRSFPITGYGAKNDGKTDNTAAIKKAIDACAAAGGGHVVVPAGSFLTGAVYLKSNVDLHLEKGAVLKFSGDASKFPNVLTRYEGIECINHSPMIYAYREKNIALTGSGTLDAAATSSWNKGSDRAYLDTLVAKGTPPEKRVVPGSGHTMRSTFVEPYACENVLIQGVTLKNSMFWQLHRRCAATSRSTASAPIPAPRTPTPTAATPSRATTSSSRTAAWARTTTTSRSSPAGTPTGAA